MEYGQFRAVSRRDMKPCLSHQSEKPDRLQGYGLTAGIRTGDDEQCKAFPERYRDWDDSLLIKQWMAAFPYVDAAFLIEHRTASFHCECEGSPGKYKVQIRHGAVICTDFFDILRSLFAQPREDHLDLLLLFGIQLFQVVVQFYNCHWFNEQGGAGRRLVMDQALYL